MRDGYWYRARRYQGPYIAVDVRRVPYAVVSVPERNWHHHPSQGRWRNGVWMPNHDNGRWHDNEYDNGNGRDWHR
jgi:hypothetical protein